MTIITTTPTSRSAEESATDVVERETDRPRTQSWPIVNHPSRRGVLGTLGALGGVAALALPMIATASPAMAATTAGSVDLDSFAGATDDIKLTAALAYIQAQPRMPWLQLPTRDLTFSQTRTLFSGLKIAGAGVPMGPKNLELASGKYCSSKVTLNVGNGASSWLVGSGSIYDVCLAGIAFQAGNASAQLLDQATGTLYACEFSNLNLYGFKHAFGSPTRKCLVTQVVFSGHWTVIGFNDTQFTLGGSDCSLWEGGFINIGPPATAGGGKPQIVFDCLSKTNVGYLYITCNNDWGGLTVKGSAKHHVRVWGGSFEGMNDGRLATRSVIDMQGGNMTMYSPWIAYVTSPAAGAISQSGGNLDVYSPSYQRASCQVAAWPMLYQRGGTFQMCGQAINGYGEQCRLRWANGTTSVLTAPSNRISGLSQLRVS